MLSEEMKYLIETSDPMKDLVILISLDVSADLTKLSSISDVHARSRAMYQAILEAKRPIVEMMSGYGQYGLKVINDLDGSPNLVLGGPAQAWKLLVRRNPSFVKNPKVKLSVNELGWRIAN